MCLGLQALRTKNIQYCAKVMRAKCANFVLCLHNFSKKILASFRDVLSVISLKQRTKIRCIFKTRTNEISQCSELTNIKPTTFCSLVKNRSHVDALLLAVVNVFSSFMGKNFNPLIVFNDTSSQT